MIFKSRHQNIEIPDIPFHKYLFSQMEQYMDSIALIDNERLGISITFGKLLYNARCCATYLHGIDIGIGDTVAMYCTSSIEFAIIMLGIIASGATCTPCNSKYPTEKILHEFKISQPKIVFVHEDSLEKMEKVAAEVNNLQKIIVIGKSNKYVTYEKVIDCLPDEDILKKIDGKITPETDLAILPYSSGTTGLPKGVMQTHKYLIASCLVWGQCFSHTNDDVIYIERPMFYMTGFITLSYAFQKGASVVFDSQYQLKSLLHAVERFKVTQTESVPFIVLDLLQTKEYNDYDMSSLKTLFCGGDSVAPKIIKQFNELRNVEVIVDYGLTELYPISMGDGYNGSSGKICPNTSVKIIDPKTMEELGVDEEGEVVAKGPQIMTGYYKNLTATADAIDEDGWFYTGDIGRVDADGYLYIVGRIKEMIKYNTRTVSPSGIQNVLLRHPKIKDAAIIGIPHETAGEIPKAFVVRTDGSLREEEVIKFIEDTMADEDRLRGGVQFIDMIPKSVFGKINRHKLKLMAV